MSDSDDDEIYYDTARSESNSIDSRVSGTEFLESDIIPSTPIPEFTANKEAPGPLSTPCDGETQLLTASYVATHGSMPLSCRRDSTDSSLSSLSQEKSDGDRDDSPGGALSSEAGSSSDGSLAKGISEGQTEVKKYAPRDSIDSVNFFDVKPGNLSEAMSRESNATELSSPKHNAYEMAYFERCTDRFLRIFHANDGQHSTYNSTSRPINLRSQSHVLPPPGALKVSCVGLNLQESLFHGRCKYFQNISFHAGPIWVLKFSHDGRYLCTGGQDKRVVVWSIGPNPSAYSDEDLSPLSPSDSEYDVDGSASAYPRFSSGGSKATADGDGSPEEDYIINPTPYRVFDGHTGDVIDLAWSKSHFILSASLDRTVSLWHVTREEKLQVFRHPDIVTSIDFHPTLDQYFVSGCFDKKLRVWNIIPSASVTAWAQATEIITSVCFFPDGQNVVGGLFNGQVFFYIFETMKYVTQMDCRNRSGAYKDGKKVTGLSFIKADHSKVVRASMSTRGNAHEQLLVTTNDSRIRLIKMEDYSLVRKYKGSLKNTSMQIKATSSEDGRYIICGSEQGNIYVWSLTQSTQSAWIPSLMGHKQNRQSSHEVWEATRDDDIAVTSVEFAPAEAVYHVIAHTTKLSGITSLGEMREQYDHCIPAGIDPSDFCTRLIVSADYEGKIKVFVREIHL